MEDMTDVNQAEELARVRMRLLEYAPVHTMEELLRKTLDELGELVDSPIGFYHFVAPDEETLSLQTWSTATLEKFCEAQGRGLNYSLAEAGVWADCIRQRSPVIHNDYASLPHRKGMPPGHAEVVRELVVPIMREGRIVAVVGVGNKPRDYTERDIEVVAHLGDVAWEIAQRKRTEELLRRSQEIAHVGSWELNVVANHLTWSDEVYRIFGLRPQEFAATYEAFLEAVHPDDRAAVDAAYSGSIREGKDTYEIEHRVVRRDTGEIRYVHEKCTHERDATGRIVRSVGMVQDITDRRWAQEALRMSEESHRATLNAIGDAMIATDSMGVVTKMNPVAEELTGWPAEEARGRPLADVFHIINADTRQPLADPVARVIASGRVIGLANHTILISREGREYQIADTAAPIHNDTGEITGVVLVFRDVTEEYAAAEALRESELRYRTLFEEALTPVFIVNAEGRYLDANEAALRFLETDRATLRQKTVWDYSPPGEMGRQQREHAPFMEPRTVETVYQVKDRRKTLLLNVVPVETKEGEVLFGIGQDITERVQLEQQLRQHERLAAVGQLAAGIAHDFRNILTTITLYVQMTMRRPGLPRSVAERLQIILGEANKAVNLVQQILDFSGRAMVQMQPVDLKALTEEVLTMLQRTLPEDIRLSLTAEDDAYIVQADAGRIRQVLLNLALNSRDAMPEGGELHFALSSLRLPPSAEPPVAEMPPGMWACLSVADTGTGMTKEVYTHIFEPFFTTKEVGKGTGLGLAQVYGIIRQHEGYIRVETEVGAGTTFHIYLPATRVKAKVVPEPAQVTPLGRGETILLVEDNDNLREAARSILEDLGYRVLTARDGRQALEICTREQEPEIALVITDVVMPEMGGRELLQELQRCAPHLKVLGITGYTVKESAQELRQAGFADVIYKPFEIEALAQMVRRTLDQE